jgi:SAM-dependent methyltransferase
MKKFEKDTLPDCSVCGTPKPQPFLTVHGRDYFRCNNCLATMLDPVQWVSPENEYAEYLKHNNSPADSGYKKFLSRIANQLLKKLDPGRTGIDYGCGLETVLAQMLSKAGHKVSLFDPFFFPNHYLLDHSYDFITCSETIEHFHRPAKEFARFQRMLRPGGWLAVMTCFQTEDTLFSTWHYRRDPTHVVFYRETTLRHIAEIFGWSCEIPVKDIALMQKPLSS